MFWRRRKRDDDPLAYQPDSVRADAEPPLGPLSMPIVSTRMNKRKGLIVTGEIEAGSVDVGDLLEVVAPDGTVTPVTCLRIALLRGIVRRARAGKTVGVLLSDVTKAQVPEGSLLRSR